jgi:hypothetical protein
MRLPKMLMGPRHLFPHVNTRQAYLAWHEAQVRALHSSYPHTTAATVWKTDAKPPVGVSGGKVIIQCVTPGCHNFPSVALDWGGIACCVDCGAIYDGLEAPPRWEEIEAALVVRPNREHRHWDPTWEGDVRFGGKAQTVEDLIAWNVEHGYVSPITHRLKEDS